MITKKYYAVYRKCIWIKFFKKNKATEENGLLNNKR